MEVRPTEFAFFSFIYRRQLIWYKRFVLKEAPPWTDDVILKTYKFINMYRELDRCTLYILEKLKKTKNRETLLLNSIFYRFFNEDQLYEHLGIEPLLKIDEEMKQQLIEKFSQLKKKQPLFNNAYLISSGGKGEKHVNILNTLSELEFNKVIAEVDKTRTPEEAHAILTSIPMVGPFLACEIWTDLTYFKWFKQGWNDNDFVNIGPGAKWGLEILYGKQSNNELKQKLQRLHEMQEEVLPTLHEKIEGKRSWKEIAYKQAYSNYPFLSITNVEGALCEFRKYWNLLQSRGKRRYFVPVSQLNLSQHSLR